MSNKVDIGFLEEKSSWRFHPRFFPSKVGGKPAWLDLKHQPNPNDLSCKRCKDPLVFLCQVRNSCLPGKVMIDSYFRCRKVRYDESKLG